MGSSSSVSSLMMRSSEAGRPPAWGRGLKLTGANSSPSNPAFAMGRPMFPAVIKAARRIEGSGSESPARRICRLYQSESPAPRRPCSPCAWGRGLKPFNVAALWWIIACVGKSRHSVVPGAYPRSLPRHRSLRPTRRPFLRLRNVGRRQRGWIASPPAWGRGLKQASAHEMGVPSELPGRPPRGGVD